MSNKDYLIVHKKILPEYYQKVVNAREMIESGSVKEVTDAVKIVGISRSTYYKYKDYIFAPNEDTICKKAVVSFELAHETGILGEVLNEISSNGANILTITQNLPIGGKAHVVLSVDITGIEISLNDFVKKISKFKGVYGSKLVSLE